MNKLEQAARQALEALENNLPFNYVANGLGELFPCFSNDPLRESNTREAITALREALAEQADQEPVDKTKGKNITRWVGLTAEERISCRDWDRDKCIRKTEHLLRSKNHV